MNRRTFLKSLGIGVAAALAAPVLKHVAAPASGRRVMFVDWEDIYWFQTPRMARCCSPEYEQELQRIFGQLDAQSFENQFSG